MKQRFSANAVAAEVLQEANTFVVCLAEELDGSGQRLELQRALSFDEQDRGMGMDTYCVATESGASYYGGVRSWNLEPKLLTLELDVEASTVLGVSGFEVELNVSSSEIQKLARGLHWVLDTGPTEPPPNDKQ